MTPLAYSEDGAQIANAYFWPALQYWFTENVWTDAAVGVGTLAFGGEGLGFMLGYQHL